MRFSRPHWRTSTSHSYLLLPSRSINPGKHKEINVKGNREMFWDLNPEKIIWTPFLQAAFPFLTFTIISLPLNSPFQQSYHLTPVSLPQLSAILFFFKSYRALSRLSSSPRWVTAATSQPLSLQCSYLSSPPWSCAHSYWPSQYPPDNFKPKTGVPPKQLAAPHEFLCSVLDDSDLKK